MKDKFFKRPIRRESLLQAVLGPKFAELFESASVPPVEVEVVESGPGAQNYFQGKVRVQIAGRSVFGQGAYRVHRIRVQCPCCELWVPAGRASQHKCESENSKRKRGEINNSFFVLTLPKKKLVSKHWKIENAKKKVEKLIAKYPAIKYKENVAIFDNCGRIVD